jgi:uncharacterized protein (TIGR03435 family)
VKVHTETRRLRVYDLVIAKGGPKLRAHPPNAMAQTGFANGRPSDGVIRFKGTDITGYAVTMASLANALMGAISEGVERPVVDKTGLQGTYDFTLVWAAERAESLNTGKRGSEKAESLGNSPSSMFTALQEQLGSKLQPATESTQMIVVDDAHMPSAN